MDATQEQQIRSTTRTMQILSASLVAGVLIFAGIVLFLTKNAADDRDGFPVLTVITACVAMVAVVAVKIVPPIVRRNNRRNIVEGNRINNNISAEQAAARGDVALVLQNCLTTHVVAAGIAEGAAFLNLVAYLIEQQTISLVLVAGLVTTMFLMFPSLWKVEDWMQSELKLIEEARPIREPQQ